MDYRCYACLAKAFVRLVEKHNLSENSREDLVKEFFLFMANTPRDFTAPEVARINKVKENEIEEKLKAIRMTIQKSFVIRYNTK